MRTTPAVLISMLMAGLLLPGCTQTGSGSTASPSPALTFPEDLGDEPLADDEVTLHMAQPPELPDELAGAEVTTSELRTPDSTDRHVVELVEVPADVAMLDAALDAGAVLRVAAGATLEVDAEVSTAALEAPDTGSADVAAVLGAPVASCGPPCVVEGPALVAPPEWLPGIGAGVGWELVVPFANG